MYSGSILITSYWIGYTALQIPAGYLADRYGTAKVSKLSFLFLFVSFMLMPLAVNNYSFLIALQILLGSLSSIVYVSGISLVQRTSSVSVRSFFIGIFQTGFFLGSSIGEYLVLRLLDISFFVSFIAVIALLFLAAFLNLALQKDYPNRTHERVRVVPKGILYVSMIRFAAGFMYLGFLSFFTTFLVYDKIVPFSMVYIYAWVPSIGGIIGSPVGGFLSRKMGTDKAIAAIIPIVALGLIMYLISFLPKAGIILASSMTGFFYGLYAGPSMGMASHIGMEENLGISSGILNFSSQVGGVISPLVIGSLYSVYGNFEAPFTIIGSISLAVIVVPLAAFIRMHLSSVAS